MHKGARALLLVIRTLPFFFLVQTNDFYPEQVKLAWTSNENELSVTWVTYMSAASYATVMPILCSEAGKEMKFKGHSKQFNTGSPEVLRYQFIHSAVISNILRECFYEYYVGNLVYSSRTFTFKGVTPTSPAFPASKVPASLIVLGDLGTGHKSKGTKDLLLKEADIKLYDGIIHLGDIAYDLNLDLGEIGNEFLRMMTPIAGKLPYMTLPGNHEKYQNFTHYKHRFKMPKNKANKGTNYFYSFNLGYAHFVLFNTELFLTDKNRGAFLTQYNWLIKDLKKAASNRHAYPWLIVGSHHPLYCSVDWLDLYPNEDCYDRAQFLRSMLEELFLKYKVDVYFSGHVHNYQRSAPVFNNATIHSEFDSDHIHINPRAPIHIVTGNAGNNHGYDDKISRTPSEWSLCISQSYGYGHLHVYNRTHLYWEQVKAPTMELVDYVWIVKDDI
mmetsp:Transcript_12097/g.23024  ORF Transcript_12097/g.23024 Transcript_12097/m.23024 type:complete len:443 (+) Transcript_12097:3-1331(+)